MMANIDRMFLAGLVIVCCFCFSISPVLAANPTYSDESTFEPCECCCLNVTIKKDPSWDYNQAQKDQLEDQYAVDDPQGSAVDDSATWTYNCHGYTFEDSAGWINSAANYETEDPPTPHSGHSGCYYDDEDDDYPVWSGATTHSSHKGPAWGQAGPEQQWYTGKLGKSVKADHTERIYGTADELLWKLKL